MLKKFFLNYGLRKLQVYANDVLRKQKHPFLWGISIFLLLFYLRDFIPEKGRALLKALILL